MAVMPKMPSSSDASHPGVCTYFEANFVSGISYDYLKEALKESDSDTVLFSLEKLRDTLGVTSDAISPDKNKHEACALAILQEICPNTNIVWGRRADLFQGFETLFVLEYVLPDLTLLSAVKKQEVLFIEVESSNFFTTVKKLYQLLLLQIAALRNVDQSIASVKGFVFPKLEKNNGVVCAEVTWDSKRLKFIRSFSRLEISRVKAVVMAVLQEQDSFEHICMAFQQLKQQCSIAFSFLPVSVEEAQNVLEKEELVLIPSKFSVIFFSEREKLVWKLPLCQNNLSTILLNRKQKSAHCPRVIYPTAVVGMLSLPFFEFPLMTEPLSLEDARKCYRSFACSVHDAISEFHTDGYAHLDIRLPNVCFAYNFETLEWYAVLIDLDRSKFINDCTFSYGCSVMYGKNMTPEEVDWRQYALMMISIIRNDVKHYHTIVPSFNGYESLHSAFFHRTIPSKATIDNLERDEKTLTEILNDLQSRTKSAMV